MSKEIVLTLKNGEVYRGQEYRYNHFTKHFELLNSSHAIIINPNKIKSIAKGKISKYSCDDNEGF